MGQRNGGRCSGLDAIIAISIFAFALALRFPVMPGPLAGDYVGPAAALHAGLRTFKTSPTEFARPIENTFVSIFAYNYIGISTWFVQFFWLLAASLTGIKLTMSTYFLGFSLISAVTCSILFFINRILFSRLAGVVTALLWATLPDAVFDSIAALSAHGPYLGFFDSLALLSLASFYKHPRGFKLYGASLGVSCLILGDPSFPLKLILIGTLTYFVYRNSGLNLRRRDVTVLLGLPAAAFLIDAAVYVAAVYKGHPMGILAYIFWHGPTIGGHRGWNLWYLFLSNFAFPNGLTIYLFELFSLGVMGLLATRRHTTVFPNYFLASYVILLLLTFALFSANRPMIFLHFAGSLMLGSAFAPGVLKGGMRILGQALFLVTVSVQTVFAMNMQSGFLADLFNYHHKLLREQRVDVGQKAIGHWIRENAGEEAVLIVTPGDFQGFEDRARYVFGSELYFGKTYCVCKGLSTKRLFTLKHLFDQRAYIDWERAPVRFVVAYGSLDRPIERLENLVNRPLNYYLKGVVLDGSTEKATIWEHGAGPKDREVERYEKRELEAQFDRKYANLHSLSWSPYQGMWEIMP